MPDSPSSDAASLATIRTNLLARIAEVTANPKPNYSVDGQSFSWQSYLDSLMKNLDAINAQINAESPFEIVTRGCS
jgi:hypothetical protein